MKNLDKMNIDLPSPSVDVFHLNVNSRNAALEKMSEGISLIHEAMQIAPLMTYESMLRNNINWYSDSLNKNLRIAKKTTDKSYWYKLLKESKLGITMNSRQYRNIVEQIEAHPVELQYDIAMETFLSLYQKRGQNFQEGLVEVFKSLSKKFKSHSAFKVQRRIIITNVFSDGFFRHDWDGELFRDAWKILYLLDGKDPTAIDIADRPDEIISSGYNKGLTEFNFGKFRVKTFANGNVHLWIDDEELLNKVNRIIANYYKGMIPESN